MLIRRYGLDDRRPATLAQVGAELGMFTERMRQLQRAASKPGFVEESREDANSLAHHGRRKA